MSISVTGREERRLREIAQARSPDLRDYYRQVAPSVDLTTEDLEIYLEPPLDPGRPYVKRGIRLPLDNVTQGVAWTDEGGTLTGSFSGALPEDSAGSLPFRRGSRVTLIANANGVRTPLWTMRGRSPQYDPLAQTLSTELVDQMDTLNRIVKHWAFKKDRAHPGGWTADRITRAVCKEIGVKVGQLEKCRVKIRNLSPTGEVSALRLLSAAWVKETTGTGRKFDLSFVAGRFTVRPAYRRNPVLYVLEDQITAASLGYEAPEDQGDDPVARPATRIVAHGRVKSGGKSKKITVTVIRGDLFPLLGRVTVEQSFGSVGSRKELEDKAKRRLAKYLKVTRTAQITHPGIPFIRKGDAISLPLPEYGYRGASSFIFVRSVAHSVSGGEYMMELDLIQVDYSAAILRQVIAAEKRAAITKERAARKAAA